jgi:hypothetical protein
LQDSQGERSSGQKVYCPIAYAGRNGRQDHETDVLGDGFKYEDFVNNPELEDLQTPIYPAYADDDDGEMHVTLMPMTTPMMLIPTTSMSVPR